MQKYSARAVNKATLSTLHRHLGLWVQQQQPTHSHFPWKLLRLGKLSKAPQVSSLRLQARRKFHIAAFSTSASPPQPPLHEDRQQQRASGSTVLRETLEDIESSPAKPEVCTADELHYVSIPGTHWKLAVWRYLPHPQAPVRNHPLLLLSGVGTNAIGFDLDPSVSFARFMAEQGFDTWILEVRGAGLSKIQGQATSSQIGQGINEALHNNDGGMIKNHTKSNGEKAETMEQMDGSLLGDLKVASSLSNALNQIAERSKSLLDGGQSLLMSAPLLDKISGLLDSFQLSDRYEEFRERLKLFLEEGQSSVVTKQLVASSERLLQLLEDGQQAVSPQLSDLQDRLLSAVQIAELQERLMTTIDDFQKMLDVVGAYDWDFDAYLEDDVPAVMNFIRNSTKPKDGKMHAIGHSMGGILLYALIASQKQNCGLSSVVTLASSVDYSASDSSLKMLLPLANPAQRLNVPAVPLGALMAAMHPIASTSSYASTWLSAQVSARDMMEPKLFKKLVLNNFCTIPAKLLLQLTTAFQSKGLRNRTGAFCFKDHLCTTTTPVLAIAGDKDLICPPSAVLDTVKALPENLVEYKLFGGENEIHYGHYDLVGGRLARKEVFPCVMDFLLRHDGV